MSIHMRAVPLPECLEPGAVSDQPKTLVLGGGCFWCVEAVFSALQGVLGVVSGYAGGSQQSACYDQVCRGTTGHAEVVEITYKPQAISRGQLLQVFFAVAHDPTQFNRQGADVGTQYRSVVFYTSEAERDQVEAYVQQLNRMAIWPQPLVTQIEPLEAFYPAEAEHQGFVRRNPRQAYVQAVAQPKLFKLEQQFTDWLQPPPSS